MINVGKYIGNWFFGGTLLQTRNWFTQISFNLDGWKNRYHHPLLWWNCNPVSIKNWPKTLRNHLRICVATYWWNKYAVMDTVYYVFHWFNMEFPWCCHCCRYIYVCHWRWDLFFFVFKSSIIRSIWKTTSRMSKVPWIIKNLN